MRRNTELKIVNSGGDKILAGKIVVTYKIDKTGKIYLS